MTEDEVAGGEFLDLQPVDLRIELPIEGFQCFSLGEAGGADTTLDSAIAASGGLLAKKQVEELEMRQRLFIGALQDSIEIGIRDRYSQDLKVAQAEVP